MTNYKRKLKWNEREIYVVATSCYSDKTGSGARVYMRVGARVTFAYNATTGGYPFEATSPEFEALIGRLSDEGMESFTDVMREEAKRAISGGPLGYAGTVILYFESTRKEDY